MLGEIRLMLQEINKSIILTKYLFSYIEIGDD